MLGDIASIATLVLFVIYFVGRIISIIIERKVKFEKIDVYLDEKDIPIQVKIVDEFKCEYSGEILIITPHEKSYNSLSIYECKYNEEKNKLEKVKELHRFNKILNDTSIKIDTILTCGIPHYILEFERTDFIKGILILQSNGKNGVEEELLEFHHTLKSIIYYLFK